MFHPWRRLRALESVRLVWSATRPGLLGATDGVSLVLLHPDQSQRQRRARWRTSSRTSSSGIRGVWAGRRSPEGAAARLELEAKRRDPGVELASLASDSIETLRETHSRYFEREAQPAYGATQGGGDSGTQ